MVVLRAQLTWLLDDNGIPANWRRMEGYAVNTFKLINSEGVANYCKFHVMPKEGAILLHAVSCSSWALPQQH